MEFAIITLLTLIIISFSFAYWKFKIITRRLESFPGPELLPILGNIFEISSPKDILPQLTAYRKKYGRVFRLVVGNQVQIFVSDKKLLQHFLSSSKYLQKGDFYKFGKAWLKNSLLTADAETWKQKRKLMNSSFHFQILDKFIDIFHRESEVLIEKLLEESGKSSVDIWEKISRCTLDIICQTAMGVSINSQKEKDSEYLKAIHAICRLVMANTFSIMSNIPLLYVFTRNYWEEISVLKVLHGQSKRVIQAKRKDLERSIERNLKGNTEKLDVADVLGTKKKIALLDLLLEAKIDGVPLSDESIQEEVDTFMFAGHDTTTATMNFLLYTLSTNSSVQKEVTREQNAIFGSDLTKKPTMADLQNMKYLEMTIKETMRMYTIAPLIGRLIEKDEEIDGYNFPKGATVMINIFGLHMDPEYYPEPNCFKPERFSVDAMEERNQFCYLAFSAGQRNCIGQRFAMLEMKMLISQILRHFEVLPAIPNHELKLSAESVLTSSNGVRIRLKRRHPF